MYTPKSVSFFQLQSWQEIVLLIKLLPYQHPLDISFFFFFLCIWLLVLFVFQTMVGSIPVHIRLAEQCWAIIIHRTLLPHLDSNPHLTLVMPYVSATWMLIFYWIAVWLHVNPNNQKYSLLTQTFLSGIVSQAGSGFYCKIFGCNGSRAGWSLRWILNLKSWANPWSSVSKQAI